MFEAGNRCIDGAAMEVRQRGRECPSLAFDDSVNRGDSIKRAACRCDHLAKSLRPTARQPVASRHSWLLLLSHRAGLLIVRICLPAKQEAADSPHVPRSIKLRPRTSTANSPACGYQRHRRTCKLRGYLWHQNSRVTRHGILVFSFLPPCWRARVIPRRRKASIQRPPPVRIKSGVPGKRH